MISKLKFFWTGFCKDRSLKLSYEHDFHINPQNDKILNTFIILKKLKFLISSILS